MQNAECSLVDLVSDDDSNHNSPENARANANKSDDSLTVDLDSFLPFVHKCIDENLESNEPSMIYQNRSIQIMETDFGLCDHTLRDCDELSEYLGTKIEQLSVHLNKEETFNDVICKTEDGFLEVSGPFQRILPISFSSHKVIREASYTSDQQYELTGSSTGFGICEDVIPDYNGTSDIDLMESHRKLFLEQHENESVGRPPLNEGDVVYAATGAICSNQWKLAEITAIEYGSFTVRFAASFIPDVRLSAKKLAYTSIQALQIGLRVIAHFKKERSDPLYDCPLFSGMIAETPKISNNGRYLIFFDNGSVSYVSTGEVYLIVEDSPPSEDIDDVDYKYFIKRYCEEYPERQMMKFQKGQQVKVRRNEKWRSSFVEEVDCSLVKIKYEINSNTEWLYRGSIRLRPIYSKLIELKKILESKSVKPRRNPLSKKSCNSLLNVPFIQYTFEEDSVDVSRHITTPKTKKTPSRFQNYKSQSNLESREVVTEIPALFAENMERTISYRTHECFVHCIKDVEENVNNFKNTNPFAIPIICKWKRDVREDIQTRQTRRCKVFYITPCGVELSEMIHIYDFLRTTRSRLFIDFFSFDPSLTLYDKPFIFAPFYYNPDLSCGREFHDISVINEVDDEEPDNFEYCEKYVPGEGVVLNFNSDFLSCCDCTDDCLNNKNCSCQRNTIEFANVENCGYEFKRLPKLVQTGIFECNSSCACKERCVNRVVQQGIKVQLQLFKTKRKGWGVRVLHDVPKGSFICSYSAEVLSDETSLPEDDKYFADLNLIDTCEEQKEGYESSVEFSSDEELDERPLKRIKRCNHSIFRKKMSSDKEKFSIRKYFNEDFSYVLDAQKRGNIGRYLNHSCDPNCFVQNVFVDTHDLRFPLVAIFALRHIKALEEICWDYNYEVGSVPGRKLKCECGAGNKCRGRLL